MLVWILQVSEGLIIKLHVYVGTIWNLKEYLKKIVMLITFYLLIFCKLDCKYRGKFSYEISVDVLDGILIPIPVIEYLRENQKYWISCAFNYCQKSRLRLTFTIYI